jgi:hypothetical protein
LKLTRAERQPKLREIIRVFCDRLNRKHPCPERHFTRPTMSDDVDCF